MLDNLIFAYNVVAPLLFLVAIGWLIGKLGFLPEEFFKGSEKFVFKIALPCSLFMSVYNAKADEVFDPKLIIFCMLTITASVLILFLLVPLFIKENARRGALIQGIFRSNFAILGIPILTLIFATPGKSSNIGVSTASIIMPFVIPLLNIFAVVTLSVFAPMDKKMSPKEMTLTCSKGVIKNPLIIAILLALPFMISGLLLPTSITSTVNFLGNTTTPLALMSLGTTIKKDRIMGNLKLASIATAIKMVLLPFVVTAVAIVLGFRDAQLGVIFILFGAPTAVSGYIMARNMKSDHELSGQILLFTTVLSALTIFFGVFILQSLGYIHGSPV